MRGIQKNEYTGVRPCFLPFLQSKKGKKQGLTP
jgi:hypothetical protein